MKQLYRAERPISLDAYKHWATQNVYNHIMDDVTLRGLARQSMLMSDMKIDRATKLFLKNADRMGISRTPDNAPYNTITVKGALEKIYGKE